ncbi:hypothetical protein NECAME_16618 [Necator americanus]|uniref:Uncharacterized protein n=1 Tax=Necator americanus TaxID=51031 RepID=W2TXV0_NECAM|nr:hypothetical protein NECAME_16618 [Necator americanus]ETN85842.1 hypothetical protein NECAME_16618 [Necator americanus]
MAAELRSAPLLSESEEERKKIPLFMSLIDGGWQPRRQKASICHLIPNRICILLREMEHHVGRYVAKTTKNSAFLRNPEM